MKNILERFAFSSRKFFNRFETILFQEINSFVNKYKTYLQKKQYLLS